MSVQVPQILPAHRSPSHPPLLSLMQWMLSTILVLSLFPAFVFAGQTPARVMGRTNSTGQKPRPKAQAAQPANDDEPADPAIVAESQRRAAQAQAEQQEVERRLLERTDLAQLAAGRQSQFRRVFPFHHQVVALSEVDADGSRTLLVTEPPPHVTLGNLLSTVGPEQLVAYRVAQHKIGYDGWVKDVVMTIRGREAEVQALLSRLHQRLFFTSYKSYTLKLPASVRAQALSLNLTVTPEEMRRWVMEEGEEFFPVEGGRAVTFASLAAERHSGVYLSRARGLIGWWIPKQRHLYECRVPARQFTLDADLVIGALANTAGIFVLGRERMAPVDILPPLRFETLALLADVQRGQSGALAQSYERTLPFAGRVADGQDWAPILLSPELRDTEYGSLLNITDQLLKGWSNNGETKYVNFDYPRPALWPFSAPLPQLIKTEQLTYNWNTKGVGYAVDYGGLSVQALYRSGALPVSYIPEGLSTETTAGAERTQAEARRQAEEAQEIGYRYFANLNDTNLARVVQYAALYQVFSAFAVRRSPHPLPVDERPEQLWQEMTRELYQELRQPGAIRQLAAQLAPLMIERSEIDQVLEPRRAREIEEAKREIEAALRKRGQQPGSPQYNAQFDRVLQDFKREQEERFAQAVTKTYETQAGEIASMLTAIRSSNPTRPEQMQPGWESVLSALARLKHLPERYAVALDVRARGWIHTPAVVVSWNKDVRSVGGHNLNARVTRVTGDATVPAGEFRIGSGGSLLVHPSQVARARAWARTIERNDLMLKLVTAVGEKKPQQVEQVLAEMKNALRTAEAAPVRHRNVALELNGPPAPPAPPRKPPVSTGEPGAAGGAGWSGNGRTPPLLIADAKRNSLPPNTIRLELRADGRHNLVSGQGDVALVALTHEDAVDVLARQAARRGAPGEPVVIEFEGLPEHKAFGTLRSVEIRLRESGQSAEVIGYLPTRDAVLHADTLAVKNYNLARATVEVAPLKTARTGELQQEIALNLPTLAGEGRATRLTAELNFNAKTPTNVISAVRARVMRAFNSLLTRWRARARSAQFNTTVRDYNKEIMQSVQKIKRRTKLDFDVRVELSVGDAQGLHDLYITRKGEAHGEPTSGAAANQSE